MLRHFYFRTKYNTVLKFALIQPLPLKWMVLGSLQHSNLEIEIRGFTENATLQVL